MQIKWQFKYVARRFREFLSTALVHGIVIRLLICSKLVSADNFRREIWYFHTFWGSIWMMFNCCHDGDDANRPVSAKKHNWRPVGGLGSQGRFWVAKKGARFGLREPITRVEVLKLIEEFSMVSRWVCSRAKRIATVRWGERRRRSVLGRSNDEGTTTATRRRVKLLERFERLFLRRGQVLATTTTYEGRFTDRFGSILSLKLLCLF